MSYFDLLPDEINCYLISWICPTDLYNLSKISPFDLICDWNFWKDRAKKILKIPGNFFDLAIDRQILGAYRYLELQTKIKPTIDSLAKIEKNTVFGIYDPQALLFKAIQSNDLNLVQKLTTILTPLQMKEVISKCGYTSHSYKDPFWIRRTSVSLYLKGLFTNSGLEWIMRHSHPFHPVYESLDEENWTEVDCFLNDNLGKKIVTRLLLSLIYTRKSQAFELVQKYLPKQTQLTLDYCLRASLNIGNVTLFETISQYIPNLENMMGALISGPIVSSYLGEYDREQKFREYSEFLGHLHLVDAYVGCNPELIERIKNVNRGIWTYRDYEIYSWITTGYNIGNDPILVYDMIKKLQSKQFYTIPSDVDIWTMILDDKNIKRRKDSILRDFLNMLFGWGKRDRGGFSPDPGNVDLLNLILSRFIQVPGTKKVMGRIKVPKGYPLTEKIYSAYLKVAL